MGRRMKYDKDFKLNAIMLCEESGRNQREFEKEMGIGAGMKQGEECLTLSVWIDRYINVNEIYLAGAMPEGTSTGLIAGI